MENRQLKNDFLDKIIFIGLKNMNDGFDAESIKYFTASDFRVVLERVEKFEMGVYGLEPWKNGNMFDVYSYDDYSKQPTDPEWYNSALNDFIATGEELLYAASYYIPSIDELIE
ncbi:MAG: hypothetical protein ACJA0U_001786 [Salibacteraceae bacterium]|jgi:hypothetical protein